MPSPTPARAAVPGNEATIPVTGGSLTNVTAQPLSLTPSFNPAVFDYAVRCQAGVNALQLTLTSGSVISAAGQSGTTLTVPVNLGEGQAAIVTAPDPGNAATTDSYWIRCLPHDFPALSVSNPGETPAGLYYTGTLGGANGSSPYAMVLDEHGTPVWYQKVTSAAINVEPLAGDAIAWAPNLGPGIGATPNGAWNIFHLDDQSTSSLPAPIEPTDPHELLPMSNGHFMMISTPLEPTAADLSFMGPDYTTVHEIIDCVVQEVDAGGTLVWSWDAMQHVAVNETTVSESASPSVPPVNVHGTTAADVFHCNSVDLDPSAPNPSDADVLVSMRHASALYRVPRTGGILWKLTGMGNTNVGSDDEPVLTPSDGFSGQHDARFRASGDVTIYDDDTWLHGPARGVEYSIDSTHHTASDVWQYAPSGGATAGATGSFRRSADGSDNVVGWGFRPGSGFTEVDASGNVLLSVSFPSGEDNYRVLKFAKTSNMLALLRSTAGIPQPATPVTQWQSLGGSLTSHPAAAAWSGNRLDVFARGGDQALYHRWWDGTTWYGWERLGGVLTSAPAVAAWGPNRLDVFARGTDNAMYHLWWDGAQWNGWEPLGGVLSSAPTVAAWASNRLDTFVQGTDNAIYHLWWDGSSWNGWENLGGASSGDPGASSWGAGRLDLFIRQPDGTMGHRWFNGAVWSGGWEWFAATLTAGPSATSSTPGEVDVTGTTPSHVPQRLLYDGAWQYWQPVGDTTTDSPAITALNSQTETVFIQGSDNALDWTSLSPAPPAATPGALTPAAQATPWCC